MRGDVRYGQVGHTNIACMLDTVLGHYLKPPKPVADGFSADAGDLAFIRDSCEHEEKRLVHHAAMVTVDFEGVGEGDVAQKTGVTGYRALATYFGFFGVVLTSVAKKSTTCTTSGPCSVLNNGRCGIRCGENVYFLFPRDDVVKQYGKATTGHRKAIVVGERLFEEWADGKAMQVRGGGARPTADSDDLVVAQLRSYHFVGRALTNAGPGCYVHVLLKD